MDLLELTVTWHDTVVDVRHLQPGETLTVRPDDAPLAAALPEGWILARHCSDSLRLRAPAEGALQILAGGEIRSVPAADGARGVLLGPGDRARLRLGETTLYFARVAAPAPPPRRDWHSLLGGQDARGLATAAVLHGLFFALLATFPVDAAQLQLDAFPQREAWVEVMHIPKRFEPVTPPPLTPAPAPEGGELALPGPAPSRPLSPARTAPLAAGGADRTAAAAAARRAATEVVTALDGALAGDLLGSQAVSALSGMHGDVGPVGGALSLGGGGPGGPAGRGAPGPWGAGPSLGAPSLAARDFARGRPGRGEPRLGERHPKAPDPVFVPQEPRISDGLSRDEIQRVIRSNRARFRTCYARSLQSRPDLQGKVGLKFTIGPDGAVIAALVEESSLDSLEVHRCLVQQLQRTTFPAPRGRGVVVVRYPFLFKPSDG